MWLKESVADTTSVEVPTGTEVEASEIVARVPSITAPFNLNILFEIGEFSGSVNRTVRAGEESCRYELLFIGLLIVMLGGLVSRATILMVCVVESTLSWKPPDDEFDCVLVETTFVPHTSAALMV